MERIVKVGNVLVDEEGVLVFVKVYLMKLLKGVL